MLARRYLHEFGGTREQLAEVALAVPRTTPNSNPAAMMHDKPLTLDDYLAAAMDQRAAVPVRQLPRVRRRRRGRAHVGSSGPATCAARRSSSTPSRSRSRSSTRR